MRTLVGETPYIIENQSVNLTMYRAWWYFLLVSILLPMRWLFRVFPKPSRVPFLTIASLILVTYTGVIAGNPGKSPDSLNISVNTLTFLSLDSRLPQASSSQTSTSMGCLGLMAAFTPTETACDQDSSGSIVATITAVSGAAPYTTNWDNAG